MPTGATTKHRTANFVIRQIRRDPDYTVAPELRSSDLLGEVVRRAMSLARAQWGLRRVKGGHLRFVERSVSISGRRACSVGSGTVIESYTQLRCVSRLGFNIGKRVTIGKFVLAEATGVLWILGEGLEIGDDSAVGDYSYIGASGGVYIGKQVLMGQRVSFHSQNHNFDRLDVPIKEQGVVDAPIRIGDNCWVGSGAIILAGVTLGEGCVVAAGAVVTKSFPPNTLLAGIPAEAKGSRGQRSAETLATT